MTWEWKVVDATLSPPQPTGEPPQLQAVLDEVQDPWEVYAILPYQGTTFPRAKVVLRQAIG